MNKSKEKDSFERLGIWILWFSLFIALVSILLFLYDTDLFNFSLPIDRNSFSNFGSFFGGVLGSIWALIGVFLFYSALKDQKKSTSLTIKALRVQIKEFKEQKIEMELTRDVHQQQHKTLNRQTFENTFFSMLSFFNSIKLQFSVNKLTITSKEPVQLGYENFFNQDGFKLLNSKLTEYYENEKSGSQQIHIENEPFLNEKDILERALNSWHLKYYKTLTPYLNYYHLINVFINNSTFSRNIDDPEFYAKILSSSMSHYELRIIFYFSLSPSMDPNFKKLIHQFKPYSDIPPKDLLDPSHINFHLDF